MELLFGPQTDSFLTELEADAGRALLLGRVNNALDKLTADPGAAECRRRRFDNIGVRGINVTAGSDALLILWEPHDDDSVAVHSITPAP